MSTLIDRTEQALIGALLADPTQLRVLSALRPDDFSRADRAALFAALLDVTTGQPDLRGSDLARAVDERTMLPGVDEAYLTGLALATPEPGHAPTYARIIVEASIQRGLADFATKMTADLARISQSTTTELLNPQPQDPRPDLLADHLPGTTVEHVEELARSIEHDTASFAFLADNDTSVADLASFLSQWEREDVVLADLVQHPNVVEYVRDWLEPEVFTPGLRRETYETILIIDEYGDPVDELTVSWELGRRQAFENIDRRGIDAVREDLPSATGPGYLARLASATVTTGVALELGQQLADDHAIGVVATAALAGIQRPGNHQAHAEHQHTGPAPQPEHTIAPELDTPARTPDQPHVRY
jgi:replicative DNA helicase